MSPLQLHALKRKARQVGGDPVLRRWLWGRVLGRWPGASPSSPRKPPYLDHIPAGQAIATRADFSGLPNSRPSGEIEISLPGETIRLSPGDERDLMARGFKDTETMLGLHRFAWLPIAGDAVAPEWVSALWRAWRDAHGSSRTGWPWHPYTAAERVINILDYARRHGLPGPCDDTMQFLAGHGEAIENTLEYFGETSTGNHLSNNGRGLFLLGLALGIERHAAMGGRILIEEAARIFGSSGALREGSSHYHLLWARNYASAWLAARGADRSETAALEEIALRALAILPRLALPGGMPLIGDISPDCPPGFLSGLLPGGDMGAGWTGTRTDEERKSLAALIARARSVPAERLERDGWWRFDTGPWAGLWHVAPDGWSPMPGHGHQDLGSFEIHFDGEPLFRDPGRGAYGDDGEAAAFVSALAHNSLTIDGAEPYPPNKPYYDDAFRRRIDGEPPKMHLLADGPELTHHGYRRLGIGAITRRWRFDGNSMTVRDQIDGTGRHEIVRRLHSTLHVEKNADGATISGDEHRFHLASDGKISVQPGKCWTAYGEAIPATVIDISLTATLPLETTLTVEAT